MKTIQKEYWLVFAIAEAFLQMEVSLYEKMNYMYVICITKYLSF